VAMRWPATLVVCVALAGCGESAQPSPRPSAPAVAEKRVSARLLDLTVHSKALGKDAHVRLMLPTEGKRPWPVLYLLHGCCDSYRSWTRSTDVESIPALRHVLVVMPEGGNVGFYSNWRDGPAWETFHTAELPKLLERSYGAGTPRAIAGLSMGGLGAMDYAARHPGMFAAAASFSGVLHPLAEPRIWLGLFDAYTGDPLKVWGDPERDRANWAAHDPAELAAKLRGTHLFVSSGSGPGDATEAIVGRESRAFAERLRTLGIPAKLHLYRGARHDWPYWQRELHRALPTLLG
jgi:diacylglycerol O-acyltransferase/trehalose O-mycolyltransferase